MESCTPTTTTTAPVTRDLLGRLLFGIAVVALALTPTQLTVTIKHIPLAPAEFLLILAAVVWAIRWLKVRDTRSLPPLTAWLLVAAGAISVLGLITDADYLSATADAIGMLRKGFAMDLAKMILYFLVIFTVFRAVFTTPQRIRTAVIALLATTSLAVALAVVQRVALQSHYQPDPLQRHTFMLESMRDTEAVEASGSELVHLLSSPYSPRVYLTTETPIEVSSTFGSWNKHGYHASRTAYAGFLALVLPFALVLLSQSRRRIGMTVWLSALFLGAAVSVLAGYVVPAVLLGLMVTGIALGATTGRMVLCGIVAYLLLLAILGGHNRTEILQEPWRLTISQAEAHYRYEGAAHLKKFWGEQQAALNLLRSDPEYTHRNPLIGSGLGQYQTKISMGYGSLAPVTSQRLESDAQNGYLLTAVNMGLLGLAALLALFGSHLGLAWQLARRKPAQPWGAALLGAMVALVVLTCCMNSLTRGNVIMVVALLAMVGNLARDTTADTTTTPLA